jgi:hypothetical protein
MAGQPVIPVGPTSPDVGRRTLDPRRTTPPAQARSGVISERHANARGFAAVRDSGARTRHTATVNHPTTRTIEEIEGIRQPEPGLHATALVQRCAALRRKPLT